MDTTYDDLGNEIPPPPAVRADGGPAFPIMVNHIDECGSSEIQLVDEGMSLRDWFAGQALVPDLRDKPTDLPFDKVSQRAIAAHAYQLADAMLVAREGSA